VASDFVHLCGSVLLKEKPQAINTKLDTLWKDLSMHRLLGQRSKSRGNQIRYWCGYAARYDCVCF